MDQRFKLSSRSVTLLTTGVSSEEVKKDFSGLDEGALLWQRGSGAEVTDHVLLLSNPLIEATASSVNMFQRSLRYTFAGAFLY